MINSDMPTVTKIRNAELRFFPKIRNKNKSTRSVHVAKLFFSGSKYKFLVVFGRFDTNFDR